MHLITNILFALQLEGYHLGDFLVFVYTHPTFLFLKNSRQQITWTAKMKGIALLGGLLWLLVLASIFLIREPLFITTAFILLCLALPLFIALSCILLIPVDAFLKRRITTRAKNRLAQFPNLTVVGIAGSYGKTTQKHILSNILAKSIPTFSPSGTHNTPLGISHDILTGLRNEHQVAVIELGEHYRGDVRELCEIIHPNIGIITGITEQHLERMGSIGTIIDTIYELPENLRSGGVCFLDTRNIHVKNGYEARKNLEVPYQDIAQESVSHVECLPEFAGIRFRYNGQTFQTRLLGEHIIAPIIVAYHIAKSLGVPDKAIVQAVANIPFVEHRLEVIYNSQTGIRVVDDSFNGNPEGVKAIVELFRTTEAAGRKIYFTPGLVELGDRSEDIHWDIGRQLAEVFDMILLIDNPAARAIRRGLVGAGYNESKIIMYPDTVTAHAALSSVLKSNDTIVFQNDWTDNLFWK